MTEFSSAKTHPLEPPGGIVVWFFIFMELLVFALAFLAFFHFRSQDPKAFLASQKLLNQPLGLLNTILLLTSGFFVAVASREWDAGKAARAVRFLHVSMLLGVLFLVVKGVEYVEKFSNNLLTGTSTFFDFYWLLTAFHAAHVLVGLPLLAWLTFKIHTGRPFEADGITLKTGAAWWHMCDLVWVLLFPILYLM
jgi:nitric oxide reductase NorE protein